MGVIRKGRVKGIISIVGPTASGKTHLAHRIADELMAAGESVLIVSVDSGAVYRELDIGTAKPSSAERQRYGYLMVDVISPAERYSVSRYVKDLWGVLDSLSTDYILLFVGGTPLYFYVVMGEHPVVEVPPDIMMREHLHRLADTKGDRYIWRLLLDRDPWSAAKIHPADRKRIIRALEICLSTGMYRHMAETRFDFFVDVPELRFVLLPNREMLRDRIKTRMEKMFQLGWMAEVERLIEQWGETLPWAEVLGYREIVRGIRTGKSLDQIKVDVFRATWSFARRQYNWFKKDTRGTILRGVGGEFADEVLRRVMGFAESLE